MKNLKKYIYLIAFLISFVYAENSNKEIFVDISMQKIYAFEDGKKIFEGDISSGKRGYETPTGRYHIIQKEINHTSSIYPKPNGGLKMPYMMRLTWDGIAIHEGATTGDPSSHGCIRVDMNMAKKLYRWASIGTRVKISGVSSSYHISEYIKDIDGYSIIEVY